MIINSEHTDILPELGSGFYDELLSKPDKYELQSIWLRALSDSTASPVPLFRICFGSQLGRTLKSFKVTEVQFDALVPERWIESADPFPIIWGGSTSKLTTIELSDVTIGLSLFKDILNASASTLESLTLSSVWDVNDAERKPPSPVLLKSLKNLQLSTTDLVYCGFHRNIYSILDFSPALRSVNIAHTINKDLPLALALILRGGFHGFSNVRSLSLCGYFTKCTRNNCRNFFLAFPSVTHLELDLYTWEFGFVLALALNAAESIALLPCLQRIVVRNVPCAEELAEILEVVATLRASKGYPISRWRVHGIFSSDEKLAEFEESVKKRMYHLEDVT